ncbi:MAG: penicillin-binding protein activator [Proteobacteria bacterium]|nr:penicillin-binding protein activator [Pseudomonadota bacterium]
MTSLLLHKLVRLGLLTVVALSIGCATSPPITEVLAPAEESTTESIDELLSTAQARSGVTRTSLVMEAVEALIEADMFERAENELLALNLPGNTPAELQLRYALIRASFDFRNDQPQSALRWLNGELTRSVDNQSQLGMRYYQLLGDVLISIGQITDAIAAYVQISTSRPSDVDSTLFDDIWSALTRLQDSELSLLAESAGNYELRGWVELARIVRVEQFSIRSQLDSINQWQRTWALHSAVDRLPGQLNQLQQTWDQRPTHIALILPLQRPEGNAIQEGFLSAYYQALEISREVPRISVYDSSNLTSVLAIYAEAVASGADLVIGPLNKSLVNQLAELPELPVKTLALNYSDFEPLDRENLFQFGLAPEDEINQAAALAWESGYRNAAIITPQSPDYLRLQTFFADSWRAQGGVLVSQQTFSSDSDYAEVIKQLMSIDSSEARADRLLDILPRNNMEFTPRRREDIDFIFLIANPRQGRQIKPTLAFYFAENIPVYSLPSIYDGQDNQSENIDLEGIVFTDAPWVLNRSDELRIEIDASLRRAQGPLQRLRAMGIDSFRLYPRLEQLASRGVSALLGTTGRLTMSDGQRIHRTLRVARFENGLVRECRKEISDSGI